MNIPKRVDLGMVLGTVIMFYRWGLAFPLKYGNEGPKWRRKSWQNTIRYELHSQIRMPGRYPKFVPEGCHCLSRLILTVLNHMRNSRVIFEHMAFAYRQSSSPPSLTYLFPVKSIRKAGLGSFDQTTVYSDQRRYTKTYLNNGASKENHNLPAGVFAVK